MKKPLAKHFIYYRDSFIHGFFFDPRLRGLLMSGWSAYGAESGATAREALRDALAERAPRRARDTVFDHRRAETQSQRERETTYR